MSTVYHCHCGKNHIFDETKPVYKWVMKQVKKMGETVWVTSAFNNKTYLIPRLYIATHGLKGKEVPSLGFKEVTNGS